MPNPTQSVMFTKFISLKKRDDIADSRNKMTFYAIGFVSKSNWET